jgi:hypothetical protein
VNVGQPTKAFDLDGVVRRRSRSAVALQNRIAQSAILNRESPICDPIDNRQSAIQSTIANLQSNRQSPICDPIDNR